MRRRDFIKTAGILAGSAISTGLTGAAPQRRALDEHRRHLAEWCRQTHDPFVVPG